MVTMGRKAKVREHPTGAEPVYQRRTVTLPPEIDAKLVEMAKLEDRPVSNLLARICREWFISHESRSKK